MMQNKCNDKAFLGVNRYVIALIVNWDANEIDILATQNNGLISKNIKCIPIILIIKLFVVTIN